MTPDFRLPCRENKQARPNETTIRQSEALPPLTPLRIPLASGPRGHAGQGRPGTNRVTDGLLLPSDPQLFASHGRHEAARGE